MAGNTVYLRGQVAQDLDTRESVAVGDPAGQAEQAMDNIELLLGEAGATLAHICKATVYLTDIRYREPVYRVLGERLQGVYPAFTGAGGAGAGPARVGGRGGRDRGDRPRGLEPGAWSDSTVTW